MIYRDDKMVKLQKPHHTHNVSQPILNSNQSNQNIPIVQNKSQSNAFIDTFQDAEKGDFVLQERVLAMNHQQNVPQYRNEFQPAEYVDRNKSHQFKNNRTLNPTAKVLSNRY